MPRSDDLRHLAIDDPRSWLLGSVRFFQTLDFYAEYCGQTEDVLVDGVTNAVDRVWGAEFPPEEAGDDPQLADMVLLLGDESRVWWRDLERVIAGGDAYVSTLHEWAAISCGAFAPEDIVEQWHSQDGPAEILFTFRGQRHRVHHPNLRDDYLSMQILRDINRLIAESGYQFAVCDNLGLPNWVVVLKREEMTLLRSERGWSFLSY